MYRWCLYLSRAGIHADTMLSPTDPAIRRYSEFGRVYLIPESRSNLKCSFARRVVIKLRDIWREDYQLVVLKRYRTFNYHWLAWYEQWWKFARRRHGRQILTCWGSDVQEVYVALQGREKARADALLRRCSAISFNAKAIRDTLLERCSGLDKETFHQIDWGIDTKLFKPFAQDEREQIRLAYGLPKAAQTILSPRLANHTYQNLAILKWFLGEDFRDWVLIVRVPALNRDEQYIAELKTAAARAANVVFDERDLAYEKLPELYALADFCVHYPNSDGIAVSALEGMSCGSLMILNRNVPSHREIASLYDVLLADLRELRRSHLEEQLRRIDEIAPRNRRVVETLHSEEVSVAKLGSLVRGEELPRDGSGR